MKKILAAWNLKAISEALNIHTHLVNSGKTWEDVGAYLKSIAADHRKEKKSSSANHPAYHRSCRKCGRPMRVYSANSDPKKRDRVLSKDGKEYKSMWLCGTSCSGKGCLYEEYSFLTVQEEIKKYRKE